MKRLRFAHLLCWLMVISASLLGNWRPNEMRIKITAAAADDIRKITGLGIDVEEVNLPHIYLYVTPDEYDRLIAIGFRPEILIPDMLAYAEMQRQNPAILGYYDYNRGVALVDSLCRQFPQIIQKQIYGWSVEKRALFAVKISDNVALDEPEPEVAFDGCYHGDEIISAEILMRLIRDLCHSYGNDDEVTRLVNSREIWIFPFANPDGRQMLDRRNKNDVDINRDWGYMWDGWGDSATPFSQPETRALLSWFLGHQFVVAQSVHAGMEVISLPWSYRPGQSPDQQVMIALADGYAKSSRYPSLTYGSGFDQLYPVNGTAKDSYYGIRGSLSWTLEISDNKSPSLEKVRDIYRSNRPAMLYLIKSAGTGLHGTIRDAKTGKGIPAMLWLRNEKQEFWPVYSDPLIGDFHKMVQPGNYTLRITANGYRDKIMKNITVPDTGSTAVNVSLEPADGKFAWQVLSCRVPGNNFSDDGITYHVLGVPDRRFYSLGRKGWIVLDMGETIFDLPGDDLKISEGDLTPEGYAVYVAAKMTGEWQKLGNGRGSATFDLAANKIKSFRFVRIEDDGDGFAGVANAGFDLDAVEACNNPEMAAFPVPVGVSFVDTLSNFNGVWESGEWVNVDVHLKNNGGNEARNIRIRVICDDEQIQVVHPEITVDALLPGEEKRVSGVRLFAEDRPVNRRKLPLLIRVSIENQQWDHIISVDLRDGGRLQTAASVTFDDPFVNIRNESKLQLRNGGSDTLNIFQLQTRTAAFQVPSSQFKIPPGESVPLMVAFTPASTTEHRDTLIILNSDPRQPRKLVPLLGTGNPAPSLALRSTDSLNIYLTGTDSLEVGWQISNSGKGELSVVATLAIDRDALEFPVSEFLDASGYLWHFQQLADGETEPGSRLLEVLPQPLQFSEAAPGMPVDLQLPFPFSIDQVHFHQLNIFPGGQFELAGHHNNPDNPPRQFQLLSGDWSIAAPFDVYFRSLPEHLLLEWQALFDGNGNGPFQLKALLNANGEMIFYYPMLGELTDEMSIRTPGATLGKPEADLRAGTQIALQPRAGFRIKQRSAGLHPGESKQQQLVVVTKNLPSGNYPFILELHSNDPLQSLTLLPLRLHVGSELSRTGEPGVAPEKFALLQNYPNPFNPSTTITFHLAKSAKSLLTVYNMLGQAVQVLVDETLAPGEYRVTWEGVNDYGETMPSGIYFYELRANEFVQIRKMILLH